MWWRGEAKHHIAAYFHVNPARLYQVRSGELHPGSRERAEAIWATEKQPVS
jgi:hypothetical protein